MPILQYLIQEFLIWFKDMHAIWLQPIRLFLITFSTFRAQSFFNVFPILHSEHFTVYIAISGRYQDNFLNKLSKKSIFCELIRSEALLMYTHNICFGQTREQYQYVLGKELNKLLLLLGS